jgi:hypothetical protein
LVDGRVYFVIFMRAHGGGTDIMVQDQREVDRELESGILPR